jgi:hypothetical protein
LLAFLIDNDHALAGIGQFVRGHEPSQPGSDNNHVCIVRHFVPPNPVWIETRRMKPGQRKSR